jgi:energy-coupling factor transporter transmembrane protein EcfT
MVRIMWGTVVVDAGKREFAGFIVADGVLAGVQADVLAFVFAVILTILRADVVTDIVAGVMAIVLAGVGAGVGAVVLASVLTSVLASVLASILASILTIILAGVVAGVRTANGRSFGEAVLVKTDIIIAKDLARVAALAPAIVLKVAMTKGSIVKVFRTVENRGRRASWVLLAVDL